MATAPVLYQDQGPPDCGIDIFSNVFISGALLGDATLQVRDPQPPFRREVVVDRARRARPPRGPVIHDVVAKLAESEQLSRELRWLHENRSRYAGRWVALRGEQVLAVGGSAPEVFAAVRDETETPLVIQVEPPQRFPFAGW